MIRKKLQNERLKRGWTQKDLAAKIGIRRRETVSDWECALSYPRPRNARTLADLFGYNDPGDLLEMSQEDEEIR